MTVVVGVPRDGQGADAMGLGALLARSIGEELVGVTVLPEPWPAGLGRIDAEYRAELDEIAGSVLAQARADVPADVRARFVHRAARSAAAGLLDAAAEYGATTVVVGSSVSAPPGRVALGSVADRLLHGAPVPVGLAPRGFGPAPDDARVSRVSAAFGAADRDDEVVADAAGWAGRIGTALRIVSFAVHAGTVRTSGAGPRAERQVTDEWTQRATAAASEAAARVAGGANPPAQVPARIGHGPDWAGAISDVSWEAGELLVVGSGRTGPAARVFLGSRASKIVRHAPVPVLSVPRHGAATG